MKLTEMKSILAEHKLMLTKSLGQNFLHDANQLHRIAEAAELSKSDKVLEIGPGLGPLTELLLEQAGQVLAIEKDERLFKLLQLRFSDCITLLHDDALAYVKQHRDWAGWKLVSNLPYSVASPILVELALATTQPERIVVTLQIEVALRICSEADSDDYGLLTLLLGLNYESRGWFKIPSSCFFPSPDVDSACITLVRRPEPLLSPELQAKFVRIVKLSFSQRRKMMHKLLKSQWPDDQLTEAMNKLGISLQIRAEKLSLEQFVELTKLLNAP
ncbi:MAG: dimethyladenosine transferase [Verrucomicrobiales bacterium]|nr:dimethyladenosine transferase [Verrucomicrobiales bacterium]